MHKYIISFFYLNSIDGFALALLLFRPPICLYNNQPTTATTVVAAAAAVGSIGSLPS